MPRPEGSGLAAPHSHHDPHRDFYALALAAGAMAMHWLQYNYLVHTFPVEIYVNYLAHSIEAKRAAGIAGAELDAYVAQMEQMKVTYRNPLVLPMRESR